MTLMNKTKSNFHLLVFSLVAVLFSASSLWSGELRSGDQNGTPKLSKTDKILTSTIFTPNNCQAYLQNNGILFNNPSTGNQGMIWPKNSGKGCVFSAGMWVIGRSSLDRQFHASVNDYQSEYQPGPITGVYNGNPATIPSITGNSTDSKWNIMQLTRSTPPTDPTYQLWASGQVPGAPMNADGTPKVQGDGVAYWVMNDLNTAGHASTSKTTPMGLEVQNYFFGFNQSGAMGNVIFMKMRIINKSTITYDSTFLGFFSDTDLGDGNDDYTGCDTLRSLGYTYNGGNVDATYGSACPADGYDFFEGPKVHTGNLADSAIYDGVWYHGYKNLPMTAFAKFINGGGIYNDPPLGGTDFTRQAYNLLNGYIGTTGAPFLDPQGHPSKFCDPGDPVTGTGWLASFEQQPADIRLLLASGPFTLAPSDTQEVVIAFIIGQGADRLNSVTVLKNYDDLAQLAFNVNFNLASPPPPPKVAAGQYHNQLILSWDNSSESVTIKDTLHPVPNGDASIYRFEGYNLWQVDGPNFSNSSKSVKLATFDSIDGITKIWANVGHPELGEDIFQPIEFGTDAGIQHYFYVTQDYLTSTPLRDGSPYYYAVTPYYIDRDYTLTTDTAKTAAVLETPLASAVVTYIPTVTPGTNITAKSDQVILSSNRPGDDAAYLKIVNPDSLNGHTYNLKFDSSGTRWSIFDMTTNQYATSFGRPVIGQDGLGSMYPYPTLDQGFVPVLIPPSPGVRRDNQVPPGYAYSGKIWFTGPTVNPSTNYTSLSGGLTWAGQAGILDASLSGLPAGGVSADSLLAVRLIFSSTKTQRAYRYVDRWLQTNPSFKAKDSSFLPYLLNSGLSYPYQDYQLNPLGDPANGVTLPFTVQTADFSDMGRQLNVALLEHNDSAFSATGDTLYRGSIDGKWDLKATPYGGGDILIIFKSSYSDTPLPQYTQSNFKTALKNLDQMYYLWVNRTAGMNFKEGDTLTITPNYTVAFPNRSFVFNTPTSIVSSDSIIKARDEVANVQVFPNPYFGYNTLETNAFIHFVTFSHLPTACTIRIFSLNGVLLNTLHHNDPSGANPFERWNLVNTDGVPIASGMYIAYIDGGALGTKILKLAVIQPQQRVNKL